MSESRPPMNRLQELVLSRQAALGTPGSPISNREVERRSRGKVSHSTVAKITAGKHTGDLEPRTAEGLSEALQVSLRAVYEAAGGVMPGSRFELPPRFDKLTPAQRQLLEDMGNALLEAYDKGRRSVFGDTPDT